MSVQPRPADPITEDFLIQGLPVVEFAFELSSGGFGPDFGLGILASAEIAKELQTSQLRNAQSGASKLVRELVRQFDATFNVTTFRHSGQNMQLIFASEELRAINASTVSVSADPFNLTDDPQDFLSLSNQLLDESPTIVVEAGEITNEPIGTGQGGTFGETTGDFALDYKINVIGDVTRFFVGTTDRTGDLVAGTTPLAGQIAIEVGAVAASGQITFPSGEAPANGEPLVADYQPSWSFTENTDFTTDPKAGRVRLLGSFDGASDQLRSFQPMQSDYNYNQPQAEEIDPYTQFTFPGRCTIRQLTDVGANLVWPVPKAQVRLTADAFVFNRDDLTQSALAVQLLEDDTNPNTPFGTMQIFREGTF